MRNLVIVGSVTVSCFPSLICSTNSGMTEPLEAMTLPYLVMLNTVLSSGRVLEYALTTFSAIDLEMPIALIG